MLLTDGEIREEMAQGSLVIEGFLEDSLQPASYDMRIGGKALLSGENTETDVAAKRGVVLDPGQFGLLTTLEKLSLQANIAGHLGVRSYYTRKGLIMLGGLQIDPGFSGVLVLGVYNASPRRLTLDYQAPFCTVEFHKLAANAEKPFTSGEEQRRGEIPRVDKDYLRTIDTQSLSQVSESVRQLAVSVGSLTTTINRWVIPIMNGTVLAVVGFGLASLVA